MNADLQALFEDIHWGPVSAHFERRTELPPDALISNVTVVPFMGDRVVIIRLADGRYEVPGGTREPDEAYVDTARRELIEEAGARLLNYTPFGAWRCTSSAEKPYRPHLPHPHFYRVAGYGEVELVSQPTNPPDGEQVVAVEVLTVTEAAAVFVASGRPDLADLVRLAAQLRGEQP
ncbi:MAG: NUDIX domain-containing protein [Chloroflexota bacterium]